MIDSVFRKCLVPEIAASLLGLIGFIVDSFFIGNFLGVDSLAASGYVYPIIYAAFAIANLLASGSKLVTAKYFGLGDKDGMTKTFSTVVLFGCVVSIVLMVLVAPNTGCIAQVLTTEDHGAVFDLAQNYMVALVPGIFAMVLFYVLVSFAQFNNEQRKIVVSVLIVLLVNLVLDLMAVFFFKSGLFGIGIATTVSYFIGLGLLVLTCFSKESIFGFSIRQFDCGCLKRTCIEGLLPFLNSLTWTMFIFVLNLLLTHYETTTAVAAFAIVKLVMSLTETHNDATGSIVAPLTSLYYVEKDERSLVQVLRSAFFYSLVISSAVMGAVLLFAHPIVSFFAGSDGGVIDVATAGSRIVVLSLPTYAIICSLKKYYQALQYRKYAATIIIVNNLLFPFLAAVILCDCGAGSYVFACYLFSDLATIVLIVVVSFVFNKGFSLNLRSISLLPRDLVGGMRILRVYGINDVKAADAASKKAHAFCLEAGIDKGKAYAVALCVEEFSLFLISTAFSSEDHQINLGIFEKTGRVTVKFTDNTDLSDLRTFQELYEEAHESLDGYPALKYVNKESFGMDTYSALRLNSYQFDF